MKKFQSFHDFENAIKNEDIHYISEEKCKDKIYSYEMNKGRRAGVRNKRLVFCLVCLLTLSMGTVAYGNTITTFVKELLNGKGEVVYRFENITDESKEKKIEFKTSADLQNQIKDNLKPGEVEILLSVDEYELNHSYTEIQKESEFYDIEKVINNTTTKFKIPSKLPEDLCFSSGKIYYNFRLVNNNNAFSIKDLYDKAKGEGKENITMKAQTTKEAQRIELEYEYSNHDKIQLCIDRSVGAAAHFDANCDVENINIGNSKALYVSYKDLKFNYIVFVDDTTKEKLAYHINFPFKTDMKEKAIELISTLK